VQMPMMRKRIITPILKHFACRETTGPPYRATGSKR
jgi:hypothetical protein